MKATATPQTATTRAARNLMTARGWKHKNLADALGMNTHTLRQRLYGHREWKLRDVEALGRLGAEVPTWDGLA